MLDLLISLVHDDVVTSGIQYLVLINQMEIIVKLSIHTKDKSWRNCDAL